MKIAVWLTCRDGGAKRALYYHVRGLVERGHELSCWSLETADQSYLPLSEFATERVVPFELNHRPPKRSRERWASNYNEALRRMRAFDDACKQCAREIEAYNFDLVFINSTLYYNVPYILRHLQMRKVLYLQEPCRYFYEARPVLPWVESAAENLKTRLFNPRKLLANYRIWRHFACWPNRNGLTLVRVIPWSIPISVGGILRSYGIDAKVCYLGVDTKLFRNLKLERNVLLSGLIV